jgi:hypothetical protein
MARWFFYLLGPDGVFPQAGDGLSFVLLPASTGVALLAILDRVILACSVPRLSGVQTCPV